MKRAIKWWPKFNLTSPEKSDFIFGASYGLITIQAYHELDMMKMAQGKNKTIVGLVICTKRYTWQNFRLRFLRLVNNCVESIYKM